MESMRSPQQTKRLRANQLTSVKELPMKHATQSVLNQQISKHYLEKTRLSQPPKALASGRTQDRLEDSNAARNTSYNMLQLTHASSQSSLHSTNQLAKMRGDYDNELKISKNQVPFEKRRSNQTTRLRKSPEPAIIKMNELKKSIETISYITTTAANIGQMQHQSSKSKVLRSKKSQEKPQKEIVKYQIPVNKAQQLQHTIANTSNTKSRQSTIVNKQMGALTKNMSLNSLQATSTLKFTSRKRSHPKLQLEDTTKSTKVIPNLTQPAIVTNMGSPRITIQLVNSSTGTSIYSTIEQPNNQSISSISKERKISISEKLAPKGKKKRVGAQKQPKQSSNQRETPSNLNPSEITNHNLSPSIFYQSSTNQSLASAKKHHSTHDNIMHLINNNTPTTYFNMDDSEQRKDTDPIIHFDDYTPTNRQGTSSPNQIFSFQHYNNLGGRQSLMEESKEVTAIFGGTHAFEGTDLRPSVEGTAEKRKYVEVPTPVFQAERSGFRTSDNTNQNTYPQNSPFEKMRPIQNQISDEPIIKPPQIIEKNEDDDKQLISRQSTLKKVQSTQNLGIRNISNQDEYAPVKKLDISNPNAQSSGNLFSKLRSFIWKNDAKSESQPEPQVWYKCKCGLSDKPYACKRAFSWLQSDNNFQEFDYQKNKKLYDDLLNLQTASGSESQIERDISRTFTNVDCFTNVAESQQQLSRVLNVFSKYIPSIGYVQGMNFLVGALLMHCTEEVAFWLFVTLFEDYEMRDIYQPKLPGLYKHSQVIQLLQMEHVYPLYQHFCKHHILVEMYASDWVFTLFSNIIPMSHYHYFLEHFFLGGWSFFYKFTLSFLKSLMEDLLDCEDISEILTIIKLKHTKELVDIRIDKDKDSYSTIRNTKNISDTHSDHSPYRSYQSNTTRMKSMLNKYILGKEEKINSESYKDDSVWERLVNLSIKEWEADFNESYILNLLSNFDVEKMIFKQSFANTPKGNTPHKTRVPYEISDHKRNSSLPTKNQTSQQDTMPKIDLMRDSKMQQAGIHNPAPTFIYKERGSLPQNHLFKAQVPQDISQSFNSRKGSSRITQSLARSHIH